MQVNRVINDVREVFTLNLNIMKNCKYILLIQSLWFVGCASEANENEVISSSYQYPSFRKEDYKIIHQFNEENKTQNAVVHAKLVKRDIFTSLVITDSDQNSILYFIDRTRFINSDGIDFEIEESDTNKFYGYKIVLLGNDYLEFYHLGNGGETESDIIRVEWDIDKKRFKKFVLPL